MTQMDQLPIFLLLLLMMSCCFHILICFYSLQFKQQNSGLTLNHTLWAAVFRSTTPACSYQTVLVWCGGVRNIRATGRKHRQVAMQVHVRWHPSRHPSTVYFCSPCENQPMYPRFLALLTLGASFWKPVLRQSLTKGPKSTIAQQREGLSRKVQN